MEMKSCGSRYFVRVTSFGDRIQEAQTEEATMTDYAACSIYRMLSQGSTISGCQIRKLTRSQRQIKTSLRAPQVFHSDRPPFFIPAGSLPVPQLHPPDFEQGV